MAPGDIVEHGARSCREDDTVRFLLRAAK